MPLGHRSTYPAAFRSPCNGQSYQPLARDSGLTRFGVSLPVIEHGRCFCWSRLACSRVAKRRRRGGLGHRKRAGVMPTLSPQIWVFGLALGEPHRFELGDV